jgi:methyltransferase
MSVLHAVLAFVVVQRLFELALAAANTGRLRRLGGIEIDRLGYPVFVALHTAWLASIALLVPAAAAPSWLLLGLFGVLQVGRLWVIATLGRRWTTRLVVLPQAAPVRAGPYRFFRHPNYLIVVGEIAVLPLAFGAVGIASVFSIANAVLLARRIRLEDRALGHASPAVTELSQSGRSAPMTSH